MPAEVAKRLITIEEYQQMLAAGSDYRLRELIQPEDEWHFPALGLQLKGTLFFV